MGQYFKFVERMGKENKKLFDQATKTLEDKFVAIMEEGLRGTGIEGGAESFRGGDFTEVIRKSTELEVEGVEEATVKSWEERIKKGERPEILTEIENGKPIVIDGNNKLQAYKNLGIDKIPTIQSTPKSIPKELEFLAQEARTYKSAEEFKKGIQKKYFLHGSKAKFDVFDTEMFMTGEGMGGAGKGMSVTTDLTIAEDYAKKYGVGDKSYVYLLDKKNLSRIVPAEVVNSDPNFWAEIAETLDKEFISMPGIRNLSDRIKESIKNQDYKTQRAWTEGFIQDLNWDNFDIWEKVMAKMKVDGISYLDDTFAGKNTGLTVFDPERFRLFRIEPSQLTDFYNQATK